MYSSIFFFKRKTSLFIISHNLTILLISFIQESAHTFTISGFHNPATKLNLVLLFLSLLHQCICEIL